MLGQIIDRPVLLKRVQYLTFRVTFPDEQQEEEVGVGVVGVPLSIPNWRRSPLQPTSTAGKGEDDWFS